MLLHEAFHGANVSVTQFEVRDYSFSGPAAEAHGSSGPKRQREYQGISAFGLEQRLIIRVPADSLSTVFIEVSVARIGQVGDARRSADLGSE